MSLFRRDDPQPGPGGPSSTPSPSLPPAAPPERRPSGPPGPGTHIASGSKITGQVNGTSDLVVDGELEGQVQLESNVTIGPEGRVKGDISARAVRIGGRVVGNVRGTDKVEILSSGRLEGDVVAPRVVLAEGAFFKGKVEMAGAQGGRKPEGR